MLRYKLKYEKLVYCRYRKRGLTFWAKALCQRETWKTKGLRSKRLIDHLTFYIGSTPTVYISTCNTKSGLKKWENLGQNVGVIVLLYFMIYAGHLPIYLHTNGFLCHDDMQLALQMSWHPTNITVMPNSCVDFSIVLFQIQSCNSATVDHIAVLRVIGFLQSQLCSSMFHYMLVGRSQNFETVYEISRWKARDQSLETIDS